MADDIKGITIKLDADTKSVKKAFTELRKDSKEVESQLKDVDRALKFDPNNTVLLESKQKLLAKAVEKTAEQLEAAKKAQQEFVDNGGDVDSASYIQMQIETEKLSEHLRYLEEQSESVDSALESTGESAEEAAEQEQEMTEATAEAEKASGAWEVALGNLISNGLQKLVSVTKDAISGTFELADNVNTLANNYNISQEAAYALYQNQELLDYSVGSVTRMMKEQYSALADGTEAYDKYGIITKGVNGELLSQERIWINTILRLREIQDPVERAAVGTELLGNKYYELGGILNATNEDFAKFGSQILDEDESLRANLEGLQQWDDMIVKLKMAIVDIAVSLGTFFGWLSQIKGLLPAIVILVAGLTAAWIANNAATIAATISQWALNAAMLANPITLIIVGVTALVAIFILLAYNLDEIAAAFKELWSIIKEGFSGIVDSASNVFSSIVQGFHNMVQALKDLWQSFLDIFRFNPPAGLDMGGTAPRINGSHANGLDYVPFDGYIAELHKGERVLTANENKNYSGNSNNNGASYQTKVNINFTGSLAQLAAVLQPEIAAETKRRGVSLVK